MCPYCGLCDHKQYQGERKPSTHFRKLTRDSICKSVVRCEMSGDTPQSAPIFDPRWRFQPRGQGFDATNIMAYEHPLEDPRYPEVWLYTDRLSYAPGDTVSVHASSTVPTLSIEIARDGGLAPLRERFDRLEAP